MARTAIRSKLAQVPTKHLNVELSDETWERFYRIQQRIGEKHRLPCNQQAAIQYLIDHCKLGDLSERVSAARCPVPLPRPKYKVKKPLAKSGGSGA